MMSFLRALMRKMGASPSPYPEDYFPSVVLLLREPLFPDTDEILKMRNGKLLRSANPGYSDIPVAYRDAVPQVLR